MNIPETKKITISRGGTDHTIELDEMESVSLMTALQSAWGWSGTMFIRADFSTTLERDITESEWQDIQDHYDWRKGLPEHLTAVGWDILFTIIAELGLDKVKETV